MAAKPSHDTLIHCEACGEDYSSTYRRCPFCGARNDPRRVTPRNDPASSSRYVPMPPPSKPAGHRSREEEMDDTYIFDGQEAFDDEPEEEYYPPRPKGGKRLAPKQGGVELPPINWPRLITFLCSLVIIVAALIIVFTFIYPQLRGKDSKPNASAGVTASPDPGPSTPVNPTPVPPATEEPTQPVDPVTPAPTAPVAPSAPTGTQAVIVNASSGLRVRSGPGTSNSIVASLYNGNRITVLAPADNGWYNISFTGSGGTVITGYIMGDYISTIAGSGSTTTTQPPATQPPATNPPVIATQAPSTGGGPTVGRAGTIVNANGGLRVRSGPGTSNSIVATLFNGNAVQVVADAGGGWYQITFSGVGGAATPGYIMGDYISTN